MQNAVFDLIAFYAVTVLLLASRNLYLARREERMAQRERLFHARWSKLLDNLDAQGDITDEDMARLPPGEPGDLQIMPVPVTGRVIEFSAAVMRHRARGDDTMIVWPPRGGLG